jgi:hypothetical protein
MVFSRLILEFIVSKEGKILNLEKDLGNSEYASTYKLTTHLHL